MVTRRTLRAMTDDELLALGYRYFAAWRFGRGNEEAVCRAFDAVARELQRRHRRSGPKIGCTCQDCMETHLSPPYES